MPRKSLNDQLVDGIHRRLDALDYTQAHSVEEAIANELIICNAFGMEPSEEGAYDYCPLHPNRVRYHEHCPQCEESEE